MKKLLVLVYLCWGSSALLAQIKRANIDFPNLAKMSMNIDEYDFGTIKKDSVSYYNFEFKNTGEVPLIIEAISSSCLCTTSIFEKEMVDVDSTGSFTLFINTDEISGSFDKLVRIIYNGDDSPQVIRIYGKIED